MAASGVGGRRLRVFGNRIQICLKETQRSKAQQGLGLPLHPQNAVVPSGSTFGTAAAFQSLKRDFGTEVFGIETHSTGTPAWWRFAGRFSWPAASMAYGLQHFHGYSQQNLNFINRDSSHQTTLRAERTANERPLGDTLLSSPAAISADIKRGYLFIADSNHHRIIVAHEDGKLVDCIGSSQGMEDGTFETAQLSCPASVIFDSDQSVLYIADSENHCIRRADLNTRTLSTVQPPKVGTSERSIWGRFLRWTGVSDISESEQESGSAGKSYLQSYPWHLKFTQSGSLLVANRSFENVWELDPNSGEGTEIQFQDSEVVSEEFCKKAVDVWEMEDAYSLIFHGMKGNESGIANPWQINSVVDVVSRVVRLHDKLFCVDTESQIIRRYNLETGNHGTLHLSNLGLLALPCWWSLYSPSLQSDNRGDTSEDLAQSLRREEDKLHDPPIHILPGRFLLCINPVLPRGMTWASPIESGSIWRQATGSIVELSMAGGSLITHKISSAQQWIDDLDDLDEPDSNTVEETQEITLPPQSEDGLPLYTLVDASLGTGEVIIDAVLYLKHDVFQEFGEEFVDPAKTAQDGLKGWANGSENQIVLKHLHTKVRIEISNSAPEERTKHITVHL